ncbi:MAG TPA: hypothetical protein VMJ12_17925 [Candidatus Acidoferrales bacterium]|nr:hypothetical protein [Candidatus Acidoferrales bacterium]
MNTLKTKLVSLFVALSLAVTYYYIVKPFAMGTPGNGTNFWVFSAMSQSSPHLNTIYPVWRSRIGGMWISGKLVDSAVKDGGLRVEDAQQAFGIYHSVWLFLFFAMLIFLVDDPLFVTTACFACMLYMFTPKASYYAYPWDIPGMTFFTLNYLLWRKRHYKSMLLVMFVGYFFKETIILSGVLFFFTDLTTGNKVRYLAATAAIGLAMKVGITLAIDGKISLLTNQFVSGTQKNLFKDSTFFLNLKELATPSLNHFIFVNGGTFIISLLLPMRTRIERGTKAVIGIFFLAALLAGALDEFRIMLDILPISILAIREYLLNPGGVVIPAQIPDKRSSSKIERMDKTADSRKTTPNNRK